MTLKIAVIIAYLGVLVFIGVLASRRMKDLRDYFAAGKKLGFWSAAFSARATGESAWLLLGLTGMGAAVGVKAFWVVLGEVIGVSIAWIMMSRPFKQKTDLYDAITIPDYLEAHFNDSSRHLRLVSAGALVVFVTIYVSAQIDATGQAFHDFLGWNYFVGAIVGFGVVLVYIMAGGFLAVAWSDVFQGTLMLLGLVLLPVVALNHLGGIDELMARLSEIDGALVTLSGAGGWTLINVCGVLSLLLIGLGFLGSPQIFARFLALKSEDEINKGTWVAITWTILADSGAVLTGMCGRSILGVDGESVLPMLVEHLMPVILVGLYIAIVLSAIMSTVDSLLVVAGSAAVRDYYQKVRRPDLPDDQLVSMSRWVTFGLAITALVVALLVAVTTPDRTIFWFVIFGWSGISATFCPTIILSLFWPRFTKKGALSAMIGGFFAVPLFKFVVPQIAGIGPYFDALGELPPAFLVSFVLGIAMSLCCDNSGSELSGESAESAN